MGFAVRFPLASLAWLAPDFAALAPLAYFVAGEDSADVDSAAAVAAAASCAAAAVLPWRPEARPLLPQPPFGTPSVFGSPR